MCYERLIGDWSAIGEDTLIYNLGRVVIGEKATISHRVHVCAGTHDYTKPSLPLLRPEIHIGSQTWVCAEAFIGQGVTVGEGAVCAARAVVIRNVEPWTVVGGNPAKTIKMRKLIDKSGGGAEDNLSFIAKFVKTTPFKMKERRAA